MRFDDSMSRASSETITVRQGVSQGVCIQPFSPVASGVSHEVKVIDTRNIAKFPLYHLVKSEAEIMRICRNTTREEEIFARLNVQYPAEEIRETLELLEAENMLLHIGDEYLTLPVDRVGSLEQEKSFQY